MDSVRYVRRFLLSALLVLLLTLGVCGGILVETGTRNLLEPVPERPVELQFDRKTITMQSQQWQLRLPAMGGVWAFLRYAPQPLGFVAEAAQIIALAYTQVRP